jgi:PRELI-like family
LLQLRTERLITCKQGAPKWIQPFLGNCDTSIVHEVSYIDPVAKRLTMCSINLTYSELLSVRETVQYLPSPSGDLTKTQFNQRAEITAFCGGWQKIKNKIETFTAERFQQNALKGREGFEMVLAKCREVFSEERDKRAAERLEDLLREGIILGGDAQTMT